MHQHLKTLEASCFIALLGPHTLKVLFFNRGVSRNPVSHLVLMPIFEKRKTRQRRCSILLLTSLLLVSSVIVSYFVKSSDINSSVKHSTFIPAYKTGNISDFGTENCTFAVVCGNGDIDSVAELRPLITSAILLSSCRIHFIIVTDSQGVHRIHKTLKEELGVTLKPVSFEIWKISKRFIEKWSKKFKFDTNFHVKREKRIYLITKLYLPFLLRHHERFVVMDTDMVFLQDPVLLWDQFKDNSSSWAYKMPLNGMHSASRLCSCVVLVNVNKVLISNLYPDQFKKALELNPREYNRNVGLFQTYFVDQAVYNLLQNLRPELFSLLDNRFNVDHCHQYIRRFRSIKPISRKTTIIHNNCPAHRFDGHYTGERFFDFFRTYKLSWLKGENDRTNVNDIKVFDDRESEAMTRYGLIES